MAHFPPKESLLSIYFQVVVAYILLNFARLLITPANKTKLTDKYAEWIVIYALATTAATTVSSARRLSNDALKTPGRSRTAAASFVPHSAQSRCSSESTVVCAPAGVCAAPHAATLAGRSMAVTRLRTHEN